MFISFARSAGRGRSYLGRYDGYTSRSPCSRPETVGVAASFADSAGGFPRPWHDDRRSGSPSPGAPHRSTIAWEIHSTGFCTSRFVSRLPGTDHRRDSSRGALGRLCLYGPGAARLHEELIPITARWTDPKIRKGDLSPYARESETKTLSLLDEAFITGTGRKIDAQILKQLQASAPKDIEQLLSHLQTRGEEYAADARKKLVERGQAEAKAMREILETQKKYIGELIAKHDKRDSRQRTLDFGDQQEELRQLESNRRYWGKRLVSLETELSTEPNRIRELYDVKATRIEPVGLVYLWPVTG